MSLIQNDDFLQCVDAFSYQKRFILAYYSSRCVCCVRCVRYVACAWVETALYVTVDDHLLTQRSRIRILWILLNLKKCSLNFILKFSTLIVLHSHRNTEQWEFRLTLVLLFGVRIINSPLFPFNSCFYTELCKIWKSAGEKKTLFWVYLDNVVLKKLPNFTEF